MSHDSFLNPAQRASTGWALLRLTKAARILAFALDSRDMKGTNPHFSRMKAKPKKTPAAKPKKLGPDRNEKAVKSHPLDKNFKQSRDIHEDRGRRQMKTGGAPRSTRGTGK